MIKKLKCKECGAIARWKYTPSDSIGNYCDKHVSRVCSCNIDPDTGELDKDEQGNDLPCIEYDYSENGFEDDAEPSKEELDLLLAEEYDPETR